MNPFYQWVAKNAALSMLLGLELFCLLFGMGWVITLSLKKQDKAVIHQPVATQLNVFAEDTQQDFVKTELEVFYQYEKTDYRFFGYPRERAISEFAKTEDAILILSGQLDESELTSLMISPERLPLKQEAFGNSSVKEAPSLIFVQDHSFSDGENQMVSFLKNGKAQDLVFQKYNQKAGKNSIKNG